MRKENAKAKDLEIREQISIQRFPSITPKRINMIFKYCKDEFWSKARMNHLMLDETDKIAKETEEILWNAYKRFNIPIVEDISNEPSTMDDKDKSTEIVVEEVKRIGEEKGKDLDTFALEEKAPEKTNISPLVSTVDSGSKEEVRVEEKEVEGKEDDSSKTVEEKKTLSPARDTVEIVKEFLNKETMEIDEPELLLGPFNFDSLYPVQTMKIASFANAKAKEKLLKSHMEDCELIETASGVLEKIMPSFLKD